MFKQLVAIVFMFTAVIIGSTQAVEANVSENREIRYDDPSSSLPIERVIPAARQEEIEARRQAIEQKVVEKKEAIAEKLSGKAVERCEEREKTINTILENREVAAQRHLDNFAAIEAKLTKFVTEKNLDLENAGLVEAQLTTTANEVQAKINAIKALTFACEEASASAPGAIVKSQISEVKQALIDYRTAIKDYAKATKEAAIKEPETSEEAAQ